MSCQCKSIGENSLSEFMIPDMKGNACPIGAPLFGQYVCCDQARKNWKILLSEFSKDWVTTILKFPRSARQEGLQQKEDLAYWYFISKYVVTDNECVATRVTDYTFMLHSNLGMQNTYAQDFTWLKDTVLECKKEFVLMPISVHLLATMDIAQRPRELLPHRLIAMIKLKKKTIQIFDSNAYSAPNTNRLYSKYLVQTSRQIQKSLKEALPEFKFHVEYPVCLNVQVAESDNYCTTWGQLFVFLQLLNPNENFNTIVKKIKSKSQEELLHIIQSFTTFVDILIPKIESDEDFMIFIKRMLRCEPQEDTSSDEDVEDTSSDEDI
jgi:hypothetical protein